MNEANAPTRDRFLRGAVHVLQPSTGYRAGLDAVLLAAAVEAKEGDHLLEAGTGAGTAMLCAAARLDVKVSGFERDPAMAELARRSIAENRMADRLLVDVLDISGRPADLQNRFSHGFANPPYFEPGAARRPAPGKEAAYTADTPLRAWILFLAHGTRRGGRITLIHRAAALPDLLEQMTGQTGEIEILPIRPHPGAAASRVLVRGRKGLRRGPITLYEGLTLHDAPGGPLTSRAAEALEGGAVEWR